MKIVKVMQNGKFLGVPEIMGTPRADQMQGTDMEKLAELDGRVCYDSLGEPKSRNSVDFHKHIKEVNHPNVYEGCVLKIRDRVENLPLQTIGGLWVLDPYKSGPLQHGFPEQGVVDLYINAACSLRTGLYALEFKDFMPSVFAHMVNLPFPTYVNAQGRIHKHTEPIKWQPADWTSFHVTCSRCMSHELVRHRWQAHVSQRSTRYVDESLSPIHVHPMLREDTLAELDSKITVELQDNAFEPKTLGVATNDKGQRQQGGPREEMLELTTDDINYLSARMYDATVTRLTGQQVPRKQARGAARFVLPMGLETQLIFGASPEEWGNIIAQRANEHADAEIREFGLAVKEAL